MKHYETIFIINTNLGDEEYGEVLSKFRDLIDKLKGVIVKVDEWGKQKLAYRLKKFDSGVYVLVDYCGDPGLIVELERNLKLDERILKYQTVKLADKADPEALIREEQEASEKRPKKAVGVTSSREVGASAGRERSAKADSFAKAESFAKADSSVKADEKSAEADKPAEADEPDKAGKVPADAGQVPADASQVPADASQVQEEKTKEEGSAEADSSAKADESAKADKSAKADESTEAAEKSVKTDEGSPEADKPAEADEVPQEETEVQKEGEKKS